MDLVFSAVFMPKEDADVIEDRDRTEHVTKFASKGKLVFGVH